MKHRPDINYLRKYLNGELDARATYQLERQAEDDPMLMDMMRGLESASAEMHAANLDDISARLQQRLGKPNQATKHIRPWKTWAIAASLLLLASVAGFWILHQPKEVLLSQKITAIPKKTAELPAADNAQPVAETPPTPPSSEISKLKKSVVAKKDNLLAAREPDSSSHTLNEVVVVGYGTQKRQDVTGAVQSVDSRLSAATPGVSMIANNNVVYGVIKDSVTHKPVPGARIALKNGQNLSTSDQQGRFMLQLPTTQSDTIQVTQIGYQQNEIRLNRHNGMDSLQIAMSPSMDELSEVVVTGMAKEVKVPKNAEPATGWKAYKKYLKEKTAATDLSGKVTLAFTLDEKGNPSRFRVLKSDDKSLEEPAIRLVRTGAPWILGTQEGQQEQIRLTISF